MPGYYIHLSVCDRNARENLSFVRGVEAPDLLKKYFKDYGLDGARAKYNIIKTCDMPDFTVFKERVRQEEDYNSNAGMHYGMSSNPDVIGYLESLSETQKQNPFYRGYLWHLLTDLVIYTRLDIDTKFKLLAQKNIDTQNLEYLKKEELKKLHTDWDKTNAKVKAIYPDVKLTPEIDELGVVNFINGGELYYVDWEILKSTIDFMRSFNPLNGNLDVIIETIMKNI